MAEGPKTLSVRFSLPCPMSEKTVTEVMGMVADAMRNRLDCCTCVRCWRSPMPTASSYANWPLREMAIELAGTENCRRNAPAIRPISPRCWPLDPAYCDCATAINSASGMEHAAEAKRLCRRERRVRDRFSMGAGCPFLGHEHLPGACAFYRFARRGERS